MPSDTAAGPPEQATSAEGQKGRPEIREEWLDSDAVKVVRRLKKADFTAYLVGGCVRDLLLGMHPKDFDVATSAHPNQVKATFRNSRLIGRRFRLAHVYYRGGKVIEVSTFRANPLDELTDLPQDLLIRHDNVFGNEQEDARRRDFTINGLFYEVDEGRVVDHVGGKADLRARLVRTIGDPDVRMREDPVRILRAIRFAAKCGLSVEARTYAAMKTHVAEIPRCAPPRVLEEVLKLLRSGASRRSFELLRDVGALRVLLPPVAEHLERSGPEAAERHLRAQEPHDERLASDGIPDFSVGGAGATPWSLPQGIVAPEVVLAEMVRTARLPRRIAERARLILAAQPLLSGERKKRRFSPQAFARQSIFPEALAIFELSVAATGKGAEQLSRWQAVFSSQDFSSFVEESEKKPASPRRGGSGGDGANKRRRRGGRRRKPQSA